MAGVRAYVLRKIAAFLILSLVVGIGYVVTFVGGTSKLSPSALGVYMVSSFLPYSLDLLLPALVVGYAIGLPLAIWVAGREGQGRRLVQAAGQLLGSSPSFLTTTLGSFLLAVKLGWLPAQGFGTTTAGGGPDLFHWLLPGGVLCIISIAVVSRIALSNAALVRSTASVVPPGSVRFARDTAVGTLLYAGRIFGLLAVGCLGVEVVMGWHGVLSLALVAVYEGDTSLAAQIIYIVGALVLVVCFFFEVLPLFFVSGSPLLERWTSGFETNALCPETIVPSSEVTSGEGERHGALSKALLVVAGGLVILSVIGWLVPAPNYVPYFGNSLSIDLRAVLVALPRDLFPSLVGASVAVLIGSVLALAASSRRRASWLVMLFLDLLATLPAFFLLLLLLNFSTGSYSEGILPTGLILGVLGAPVAAVALRGETRDARSRLVGAGSLLVGTNVAITTTLGYLGLVLYNGHLALGGLFVTQAPPITPAWDGAAVIGLTIVCLVFVFMALGSALLTRQARIQVAPRAKVVPLHAGLEGESLVGEAPNGP